MKIQKMTASFLAIIMLSGCSSLRNQFFGTSTVPTASTKPLEYSFSQPRRKSLNAATVSKLNNTSNLNNAYRYYSANGHECRNISSDFSRIACKVDDTWKESAPVLVVRIP
jgi:hypothetical protein